MTTQPKLHPLTVTEPAAPGTAASAEVTDASVLERAKQAPPVRALRRVGQVAFLLVPGALTLYLAFSAGGFYPEDHVAVLALLALGLVGYTLLSRNPFSGLTTLSLIAAAALISLSAWALASGGWSDAPGRALLESQRTGLYACAFLLFAAVPRRKGGVATMVRGIAFAIVVVCVAGLATRLYPDVFEGAGALAQARLSHPITYWNALGLLAAVGVVLCLHLTCHEREPVLARVAGAAGVPIAALTLYFTFSRGATAAVAVGVIAYLVLGRPRGTVSGLVAVVPATLLALRSAYDADLLASAENTTNAAAAQGHDLAAVVIAACVGAALLRLLMTGLDRRLRRIELPELAPANRLALAVVAMAVRRGRPCRLRGPRETPGFLRQVPVRRPLGDGRPDAPQRHPVGRPAGPLGRGDGRVSPASPQRLGRRYLRNGVAAAPADPRRDGRSALALLRDHGRARPGGDHPARRCAARHHGRPPGARPGGTAAPLRGNRRRHAHVGAPRRRGLGLGAPRGLALALRPVPEPPWRGRRGRGPAW